MAAYRLVDSSTDEPASLDGQPAEADTWAAIVSMQRRLDREKLTEHRIRLTTEEARKTIARMRRS